MSNDKNRIEPRTLSGFVELLPKEQKEFEEMVRTIKSIYERFGFLPIDTSIVGLTEILLAKAGGETEKQIYRFTKGDNDLTLRFDLTVPMAKYVAENYANLKFPYRVYQIGKVYRGERAQRGRYREFYQADIDIIGDGEINSINDAEIPSIIYNIFEELGFGKFTIRINNRKVLNGFFEMLDLSSNTTEIIRIIDKIEKMGSKEVRKELLSINIDEDKVDKIMNFISIKGDPNKVIYDLRQIESSNQLFNKGLNELEEVIKYIRDFGVKENYFEIDLTIARGLDYYTGTVYETFIDGYEEYGSVCSGGRYDDLAGYYIDKKLPGVGISIGLSRLFYLVKELNLIEEKKLPVVDVLIIPMMNDLSYCIRVATILRAHNINTQIYYEDKSMKSKINYANQLNIPYVIFLGEEELNKNLITIKNLATREQVSLELEEVIKQMTESK